MAVSCWFLRSQAKTTRRLDESARLAYRSVLVACLEVALKYEVVCMAVPVGGKSRTHYSTRASYLLCVSAIMYVQVETWAATHCIGGNRGYLIGQDYLIGVGVGNAGLLGC